MSVDQCPIDFKTPERILLGHGSGGEMTQQLIDQVFKKYLIDEALTESHDSVTINLELQPGEEMAITTDAFVVSPLEFPGGDIGKLAILGSVNDLAMSGAQALFLTSAFILEEGFQISTLNRLLNSMSEEISKNNLRIVSADTKVVERGHGDGLYIQMSAIGKLNVKNKLLPKKIKAYDSILISGDIGRHGIAVLSQRENLNFQTQIKSDCQSLFPLIAELQKNNIDLHCARDLTRGGLATCLVELAESTGLNFLIEESAIPVNQQVQSACDLLGLDPMFVANEGTCILFVPSEEADRAINLVNQNMYLNEKFFLKKIGQVSGAEKVNMENQKNDNDIYDLQKKSKGKVLLKTLYGPERRIFRLRGEQLPRIC